MRVLAMRGRVLGAEHPDTLMSMNNLAADYQAQGKYVQAEELLRQALGIDRRMLGLEHPDTLRAMSNLGVTYYLQGKYRQAEPLY